MSISRRQFSSLFTVGCLGILDRATYVRPHDESALCVIVYNVFACTGWPKDRAAAKETVADGSILQRMATELSKYNPDIVGFSESPSEKKVKAIAKLLKMNYAFFPSPGSWPGALLTRFEIVSSKNVPIDGQRPKDLFTRHWGRCTVKLPTGEHCVVDSVHLYPTTDVAVRIREINCVLRSLKSDIDAGHSVLVTGDMNHGPETEEYRHWIDGGLIDTFVKAGSGNGFTYRSDIPKWRIDYVMAVGPISRQDRGIETVVRGSVSAESQRQNRVCIE